MPFSIPCIWCVPITPKTLTPYPDVFGITPKISVIVSVCPSTLHIQVSSDLHVYHRLPSHVLIHLLFRFILYHGFSGRLSIDGM